MCAKQVNQKVATPVILIRYIGHCSLYSLDLVSRLRYPYPPLALPQSVDLSSNLILTKVTIVHPWYYPL